MDTREQWRQKYFEFEPFQNGRRNVRVREQNQMCSNEI